MADEYCCTATPKEEPDILKIRNMRAGKFLPALVTLSFFYFKSLFLFFLLCYDTIVINHRIG